MFIFIFINPEPEILHDMYTRTWVGVLMYTYMERTFTLLRLISIFLVSILIFELAYIILEYTLHVRVHDTGVHVM